MAYAKWEQEYCDHRKSSHQPQLYNIVFLQHHEYGNSKIYIINPATFSIIATIGIFDSLEYPLVYGNEEYLYFVDVSRNTVYCYKYDGTFVWSRQYNPQSGCMIDQNGRIWFMYSYGYIIILNSDGSLYNFIYFSYGYRYSLSKHGYYSYVSSGKYLGKFDSNYNLVWNHSLMGHMSYSVAIFSDDVVATTYLKIGAEELMYCIRTIDSDGNEIATRTDFLRIRTAHIDINDYVYVCDEVMYSLFCMDKNLLDIWVYEFGYPPAPTVSIKDDYIFVGTYYPSIECIRNGNLIWRTILNNNGGYPSTADYVYENDESGYIYKLDYDGNIVLQSQIATTPEPIMIASPEVTAIKEIYLSDTFPELFESFLKVSPPIVIPLKDVFRKLQSYLVIAESYEDLPYLPVYIQRGAVIMDWHHNNQVDALKKIVSKFKSEYKYIKVCGSKN